MYISINWLSLGTAQKVSWELVSLTLRGKCEMLFPNSLTKIFRGDKPEKGG